MTVTVYPRFALVTNDEADPIDVCDNCKKEWKRGMLCEVKDYFQRVEPGGVVPSGECPACGALCYPKEMADKELKEWFQKSAWIYPRDDKEFNESLIRKLMEHFGESCRVWQNSNVGSSKYPQLLASVDPRGIGGDTAQVWRDGQTWWPMIGDYSLDDMAMLEIIVRKTIVEFLGKEGR